MVMLDGTSPARGALDLLETPGAVPGSGADIGPWTAVAGWVSAAGVGSPSLLANLVRSISSSL
jgi:hypothetical protein